MKWSVVLIESVSLSACFNWIHSQYLRKHIYALTSDLKMILTVGYPNCWTQIYKFAVIFSRHQLRKIIGGKLIKSDVFAVIIGNYFFSHFLHLPNIRWFVNLHVDSRHKRYSCQYKLVRILNKGINKAFLFVIRLIPGNEANQRRDSSHSVVLQNLKGLTEFFTRDNNIVVNGEKIIRSGLIMQHESVIYCVKWRFNKMHGSFPLATVRKHFQLLRRLIIIPYHINLWNDITLHLCIARKEIQEIFVRISSQMSNSSQAEPKSKEKYFFGTELGYKEN